MSGIYICCPICMCRQDGHTSSFALLSDEDKLTLAQAKAMYRRANTVKTYTGQDSKLLVSKGFYFIVVLATLPVSRYLHVPEYIVLISLLH